ncbi:MAG: SLC13 family permease [Candidatus Saccharibacteria bacterium]
MFYFWLSIVIFIAAYALIVQGRIHHTIIAIGAGFLSVAVGVLSQERAIESIDFNTIGLLVGMMILVGITRQSGIFEYLAIKSTKLVGGRPLAILVVLSLVTAVLSAFLNNVTVVLLMVPVTFAITDRLNVTPIPFLFAEILTSNIGGTATLIGDPPNIMIGSAVGYGFMDFIANLTLPVLIIMVVTMGLLLLIYRKQMQADPDDMAKILELDEVEAVKDWALLKKSMLVLALTIVGFMLPEIVKGLFGLTLHLEAATVAMVGASALMLISMEDPEEILLTVEWPTIFFFIGLFVIVGGLEATGVIKAVAEKAVALTEGSVVATGMLVLWLSAIASAFVDNIPFVATMIPLLQDVGQISHMPMDSIWWALALGACLGGNGTLVGASANVIVAGIAERYGNRISFMDYLKIGFPLMIVSIVISSLYLYLAFWRA